MSLTTHYRSDGIRYRSGYSYKDPRQERVLAIRLKRDHFQEILSQAVVTDDIKGPMTAEQKSRPVRVQWDPERDPRLRPLPYRSIQVGISGGLGRIWSSEWISSIADVTEMAKATKNALEGDPDLSTEGLVDRQLMPVERPYPVSEELKKKLRMHVENNVCSIRRN